MSQWAVFLDRDGVINAYAYNPDVFIKLSQLALS